MLAWVIDVDEKRSQIKKNVKKKKNERKIIKEGKKIEINKKRQREGQNRRS